METIKGYDLQRETKKDIIYVRVTKSMIKELRYIRTKTGIPVSEIVRESVRKTDSFFLIIKTPSVPVNPHR